MNNSRLLDDLRTTRPVVPAANLLTRGGQPLMERAGNWAGWRRKSPEPLPAGRMAPDIAEGTLVKHLRSLREFIDALESIGDLQRIDREVDWHLEVGAIIRRSYDLKAPAPLFTNL